MTDVTFLEPAGHASVQLPLLPLRVLGIDLGTTNSTVAEVRWDPAERGAAVAREVPIPQETSGGAHVSALVASIVALHGGRVHVGARAKEMRSNLAASRLVVGESLFYDCKNEIGLRRTYEDAPERFRSPAEIGGHVLRYLLDETLALSPGDVDRIVVTVPASFQAAQREDTIRAARLAGIELAPGDLLDEPVAAFIDLLVSRRGEPFARHGGRKNLVVFDLGGGTCDVALFRLEMRGAGAQPEISPLAVSRYHRLGGGDMDSAILYEVLLPQLREQNDLGDFELLYADKKERVEPVLLGVAETLKTRLCAEIVRRQTEGKYDGPLRARISVSLDETYTIRLEDRTLRLAHPRLSVDEFERALGPFFDQDLLYARETEYRLTGSVVAPLQDALERAGVEPETVDYCLLVGGGSLVPHVLATVGAFFPNADVVTYPDAESIQTAVARGAAYHALSLALFGKGIVRQVAHESIAVRADAGVVEIVPRGAALPFPLGSGAKRYRELAVPETSLFEPVELRVEVVSGPERQLLLARVWEIAPPVERGDPLEMAVRFDENQTLSIELRLAADGGARDAAPFAVTIENPITHVVNPQEARVRIGLLEEELRSGRVPNALVPDKLMSISSDYADLGQREKALDCLRRALKKKGAPDAEILNKMGIIAGELGDRDREEKFYREAAAADETWASPLFNLALAEHKRGDDERASETIDRAIARQRRAPYFVLRAQIREKLGDADGRARALDEALETFGAIDALDDWALGWYQEAAEMAGDKALLADVRDERARRKKGKERAGEGRGHLPIRSEAARRSE